MIRFLSLGSSFSHKQAALWPYHLASHKNFEELRSNLSQTYGGQVTLYYRGRGALTQAISLGAQNGSVIVNGFTCYAVEQAADAAGIKVVFADVEKDKFHFGIDELKAAYDKNVKAVIVQNTFGITCDIDQIKDFCTAKGLILIEDMAHSYGSKYANGDQVGTVGDIAMMSFGRDKHLDAVNGGALIVRKSQLKSPLQPTAKAGFITRLRDRFYPALSLDVRTGYALGFGKIIHKLYSALGLLSRSADGQVMQDKRMSNLACKRVLKLLQSDDALRRNRLIEAYGFKASSSNSLLRLPVLVDDRSSALEKLDQVGLKARDFWYDYPVGPIRFKGKTSYKPGQCPNAESVCARIINLPLHRYITPEYAAKIKDSLA